MIDSIVESNFAGWQTPMTQLAIVFWDLRVAWFELLFYKTFYINAVSMNSRSPLPHGLREDFRQLEL